MGQKRRAPQSQAIDHWFLLKRLNMSIQTTREPTSEPLTLDEVKLHLSELADDKDALIRSLIIAAREHCEAAVQRCFVTRRLRLYLDKFVGGIKLPYPPVMSVESVTYLNRDGAEQVIESADYRVDAFAEPGRLTPAYDAAWPSTRRVNNAVWIDYTAGYGSRKQVPRAIKQAMLLLIGHWYENRESTLRGVTISAIPMGVDALLQPYRIIAI